MIAPALLLVEDDPNVADTLSMRLGAEGFAVTPRVSVRAARAGHVKHQFSAPCWMRPDGNGFEVASTSESDPARDAVPHGDVHPEDRIHGLERAGRYMTSPRVPQFFYASRTC